jgi:hypothetical protein
LKRAKAVARIQSTRKVYVFGWSHTIDIVFD